jgi:hypothetical protein
MHPAYTPPGIDIPPENNMEIEKPAGELEALGACELCGIIVNFASNEGPLQMRTEYTAEDVPLSDPFDENLAVVGHGMYVMVINIKLICVLCAGNEAKLALLYSEMNHDCFNKLQKKVFGL